MTTINPREPGEFGEGATMKVEPVAGVEVRDALEFYRVEAEAAAKAVPAKQTDAMAAIVTVMSLDGGRRAREAIATLYTLSLPAQEPVAWRTEYRSVYRGHDTGWHHHYSETKPNPAPLVNGCGHKNVTPLYASPQPEAVITEEVRAEALRLLKARDERDDKVQEIIEDLREIVLLMPAASRPDGLFKHAQDAVYAMRGRTRLMDDAALTAALKED